jgi:hypothetical protein
MTRFLAFVLFAAAAFAQNGVGSSSPPPADVDKALRARIAEFFQDLVDGQFRKAEGLVAEDSKDSFYASNKPKYASFEVTRIDYSDNFTRAKASVLCEQTVLMPGFAGSFKMPTPTAWKIEDGKWFWYLDRDALLDTPFGRMKPPATGADGKPVQAPMLPPGVSLESADIALNRIKVDKTSLALKAGGSGQLTLSNTAPGVMSIASVNMQGFEVTPGRTDLKGGEKATVTVKALAGAPKASALYFQIMPTMEQLVVKVTVE